MFQTILYVTLHGQVWFAFEIYIQDILLRIFGPNMLKYQLSIEHT